MEWKQILAALISGGVLTAIIKGVFDLIKHRMSIKDAFPNAIKNINRVYARLNELKARVECDRVLIITTHNGGGIPRAGAPLYASVLYETYDKNVESIRDSWQNRRVDEVFIKVLAQLETEDCVEATVDEMDEGALKYALTGHSLNGTIIAKIKSTPESYYYLSCSFKNVKKINVEAKLSILDTVSKIKDIL